VGGRRRQDALDIIGLRTTACWGRRRRSAPESGRWAEKEMKIFIEIVYAILGPLCILGFRRKIAGTWKLLLSLLCAVLIHTIIIVIYPSLPKYGPLNELAPISAMILLSMLTLEIVFILYAINMVIRTVIGLRIAAQQPVSPR